MEDAPSEYLQARRSVSLLGLLGIGFRGGSGQANLGTPLRARFVGSASALAVLWPCSGGGPGAAGGRPEVSSLALQGRRRRAALAEEGRGGFSKRVERFGEAAERRLGGDQALAGRGPAERGRRWLFSSALPLSAAPGSWRSAASQPVSARVSTPLPLARAERSGAERLRIFKRPPVRLIHDVVVVGAFLWERLSRMSG